MLDYYSTQIDDVQNMGNRLNFDMSGKKEKRLTFLGSLIPALIPRGHVDIEAQNFEMWVKLKTNLPV